MTSQLIVRLTVSPNSDEPVNHLHIGLPSGSLIAKVVPITHNQNSFCLHLYDIASVLFSKTFNDTFTVIDSAGTRSLSVLKILQLWLAHIPSFSTERYEYAFEVISREEGLIAKYVASLKFLDSVDSVGAEPLSDTSSSEESPSKYVQLSDEEEHLSAYRLLDESEKHPPISVSREAHPAPQFLTPPPSSLLRTPYTSHIASASNVSLQASYSSDSIGFESYDSVGELQNSLDSRRRRRFHQFRRAPKLLTYEPNEGTKMDGYLILKIVSAKNLPPFSDSIHMTYDMDPFVVVSLGTKVFRTAARRHTLNPVWHQQYVNMEIPPLERDFDIEFNVLDRDKFTFNDRICSAKLKVRQLTTNENAAWRTLKLDMNLDPKTPLKYKDYAPEMTIEYFYVGYQTVLEGLLNLMPSLDPASVHTFNKCPSCGRADKRNTSLIKHLSICLSAKLRPEQFLRKSYTTSQSATRRWYSKALVKIAYGKLQLGGNNANIMVQDRDSGLIIEERMSAYVRVGIRMLYKSIKSDRSNKKIKKVLCSLSKKQGVKYDAPQSSRKIASFVRFYALDLGECLEPDISKYATFNDFFYRKLREGARPVEGLDNPNVVTAIADSRLTVYQSVALSKQLWIKGRDFTVSKLLGDAAIDDTTGDSLSIAIFRLAPQDYHRFHSPVDGVVTSIHHYEGEYYTVNPMAIRSNLDVFGENVRTVVQIETAEFGKVVLCAVGAMMVGSILMTVQEGDKVSRGKEIGYFKFGGSTVIMLMKPESIRFDSDLSYNSETRNIETLVKVGMSIGHKPETPEFVRHKQKNYDRLRIIRTITGNEAEREALYGSESEDEGVEESDSDSISMLLPSWEVEQMDLDDYEVQVERRGDD